MLIKAAYGPGGRDHGHVQFVDFPQFSGLGFGGAGHSGQLVVHAEEVLQGDGGYRLGFVLQLDALLGLECLVQAVGEAPARLGPTGGLVDDDHSTVFGD